MMNYKDIFFLIIVFLTQTFQGVSQGISSVDSLKNKLVDYSEDTTSIKIMEQIFNEYYYSNLDSAKQYYNKILFVSEKLNFEKGTNTGYYLASKYFWKKGDLDSSLFNIEKCEAYAIKYNDNLYLCDIYLKMANIYTYIGNIDDKNKSKQLLNKAFQMGEKLKDDGVVCHALQMMGNFYYEERDYKNAILNYLKIDSILTHKKVVNTLLATTLSNVGFIYTYLKNYDKAEKYFVKTRDLYIDLGNVEGVAYSNFSMGTLFLEKDDYELAINHFHQALDFYIDYGDFGLTLETYSNLGLAYVMINNLEEAQKYYNSALELSVKIDRNIEVAKMYFGVGNLYKIKKSYKEALKAYQKALDIYNNLGQYSLMERAEVYDGISDLYSNIGDFKKAYEYRVIYEHLNDSLHFKENNEVANEIEEKYQNEKKEREIASLNEKNILIGKQKESQSILYLSVFCFLLILVLTFYLLYKSNRKGKEHLKKVDDLKSRFITNISHEFRTPLTMINGIVEKNYSQDNSGVFSNLDMISVKNNVGSLLELVDQLLELARVESGDLKLSVSSIDVFRILNDFVPSFQLWAEKKDIQFNWKIPVYSKIVWVDPDVLHKVVINILSNAFKYTPQYGTVTFEAKIEKDTLYIEVTNSGEGLDISEIEKVFDRFYQGKNDKDGVGIGLSLVKELCNLSHGEIVVKSTPNELTSFKAILPVGKHHFKNNELDKESKYEISGFIPKTNADRLISSLNENNLEELPVILVVEDHVEIREFLVGILSKEYNVLNADNGKTGVELAFEHIPDLIISDVIMPAMDGFDLCKTIKSDERTSHVPVILLTAREGDENKLIGLENGADDYLIKPFSIALLKARVKNLIELRKKLIFSFNKNPDLNGKKEEYLNTMDQTFMKKIEEILRRNIKNPDFTVELFSNEANLSRMQFHRKVKAITGHSANAIIRTERLKLACKLLSESKDGNIADVAYESGFSDASYFAKCFKETYNCTPKEYAKSQANSN